MRILIVEDDKIIGDGLLTALQLEGYAVDWTEDKESAKLALKTNEYDMILYDMILMDIGLPDGSGLDLLSEIRANKNGIPILMLTAYDKVNYKVQGLDAGADDYLIKPFKLDELKARIRALHRRREGIASPLLNVGDIELNPATKRVKKDGNDVPLGPKEFAILQLLMEKPDAVLSKQAIEDSMYGWGMEIESNTIEVHVSKLRKKLGKDIIETIKYVGYRLAVN
ncbi:MAG: response regulator [Rickettsiales bacterium]|nr:response regulator [Pseudomonadota bacterium]MDA0967215.1 response regulator [Pseudomonadota bacterium]MDG4544124.1 response regulator [Rickettsiales bacterium]MDG4546305.1 response regulator [Rickettsiales bacterium]MDG4548448.1 response regulator [Rickettsiales bacterium]